MNLRDIAQTNDNATLFFKLVRPMYKAVLSSQLLYRQQIVGAPAAGFVFGQYPLDYQVLYITGSRILRTLGNLSPLRRCQLALEPIQ